MDRRSGTSDGARLRSAMAALGRRLRREDGPGSIGPTGLAILGILRNAGAASASELAALAGLQPQSITRALHAMEREKLIGRRSDEADRRRAILWATPKGEDLLRTTMHRRVTWLNNAIAQHLSNRERATLRSAALLLQRLAELS
jgi:DNA-binding MarR family transcriptional regulator